MISILFYREGLLYSLSSVEDDKGDGHFAVKEADTKWEGNGKKGKGGIGGDSVRMNAVHNAESLFRACKKR